jgi:hypothetical protein
MLWTIERRLLRNVFAVKRKKITENWRKLHDEKLHVS